MTAFDTVLVVDWSAALAKTGGPKKDSIWTGVAREGVSDEPVFHQSRLKAEDWIARFFDSERAAGRRVLAAFDFPFGYPKGFAKLVAGSDDPLRLWDWLEREITDDPKGRNNRFEVAERINRLRPGPGPFWGKHRQDEFPGVPYRKQGIAYTDFDEWRETDRVAKAASSCFQLAFPPTVGGQSLTGLPVLARLRRRAGVRVWPFEDIAEAEVVLAEIWPTLVDEAVREQTSPGEDIRDAVQVRLLSLALSRVGPDRMAAMMDVPPIAKEEAWILGADHRAHLTDLARGDETRPAPPRPPRLRNDCFALPAGVDWVPVDAALARLRESLTPVVGTETAPVGAAVAGRVLAEDAVARRSHPPAANSAVDGYGFAHAALAPGANLLPLAPGRAAAGAPWKGALPKGQALRVLTGALIPPGVDTVVLDEDVTLGDGEVAFEGRLKKGANTRAAGEDVAAGATALPAGRRLTPADLALLAAVGLPEVTLYRKLRVGVLSTGDELADPGPGAGPERTFDANRPMLLSVLDRWGYDARDLGIAPDDHARLRAILDRAAKTCDAIFTSGGASAGDEDHVSAILAAEGRRETWRIALKPGRPLALGLWKGVPVFGLPGNPVAALVCTLVFGRPALGLLAGSGWSEPRGLTLPAAFTKSKKPGRREFLRARLTQDGAVEVFRSEGSGRISGLSWAEGLAELPDAAAEIAPGAPVRYLPFTAFGL